MDLLEIKVNYILLWLSKYMRSSKSKHVELPLLYSREFDDTFCVKFLLKRAE